MYSYLYYITTKFLYALIVGDEGKLCGIEGMNIVVNNLVIDDEFSIIGT